LIPTRKERDRSQIANITNYGNLSLKHDYDYNEKNEYSTISKTSMAKGNKVTEYQGQSVKASEN